MTRPIRISMLQAKAAGLLDPAIRKHLEKTGSKPCEDGSPTTRGRSKEAKRRSKPAIHPERGAGPAGTGKIRHDSAGHIEEVEFHFIVVPVPKERARVVRNPQTGKIATFTPSRTNYFSSEIKSVVDHVFRDSDPLQGPIEMSAVFRIEVPASWPKWKREAALRGWIVPTDRPDIDNLEKALLDALNQKAFKDDAYVVRREGEKTYAESAGIDVKMRPMRSFGIKVTRAEIEKALEEGFLEAAPGAS